MDRFSSALVEHFSVSVGEQVVDCSCLHGQSNCEDGHELCYFRDKPWEKEAHLDWLSINEELVGAKGQVIHPDVLGNNGKKEKVPQPRKKRDIVSHRRNESCSLTSSKKTP
ncbi:hypothetical protein D1R32_gp408 [Tunisvirus fontaine2]|uniref:Uncharacterized protein n=1 Tax=Tunisvirus fontaine2 TaxID=1421067 RepID=V9SEI0_9VIRU|nr:hypothetical protein D1R32_gp408 [Tunisvirus fontaine2]AHC55125.1 hypothetical protein TNS_ORF407 [Tunisvirus fontaine2]